MVFILMPRYYRVDSMEQRVDSKLFSAITGIDSMEFGDVRYFLRYGTLQGPLILTHALLPKLQE